MNLDKRKSAILRAIVRDYVRTGQPVGSQVLAQRYRLKVSAATIRNDMGVLEELGYLSQPYTSAGRIPTDKGYRWFVDNWPGTAWPDLTGPQKAAIEGAIRPHFADLHQTLESTSRLLSKLTEATAVATAPPPTSDRLRRIELFSRADGRVTLLLVADTGVVEQSVVELSGKATEEDLEKLAKALNKELVGTELGELSSKLLASKSTAKPKPTARELQDRSRIATEIDRIVGAGRDRIFRGGTANILSSDKFADIDVAHDVVGVLEQTPVISGLLEAARRSSAVVVFIGHELQIEQMQSCAVILAPYEVQGDRRGAVGVVGPTRMDYPHTISAVEAVAAELSRMLDGLGD
ncbi:MAG TPA: heat-inducible transcriptional repressor HrcA [Actinomycetota bacterium]|nr:heat-inducible transcriptional repressor HrcA [Actinomycetota bacterium]